ncbi:Protein tilB [Chamberlinius hualienensis]
MVFINEDLIRKRAEHNEGEIFSLEELSLHQLHIEKIEHVDRWCRDLKILYLQANLIGKIENVSKLKKLEYLNLAMNNVTRIENLEGCESLRKLDLTLNFIKELTSVRQLNANYNLTELFLIGNPCADYQGYRKFVIATLPQLQFLDGKKIERSERNLALKDFDNVTANVEKTERDELKIVNSSATAVDDNIDETKYFKMSFSDKLGKFSINLLRFWTQPTDHSIETRIKMYRAMEKASEEKSGAKLSHKSINSVDEKQRRLLGKDGRVLNINESKLKFKFMEDDNNFLQLEVAVYKFMDTSLVKVNLEPTFIQIEIKGKMLQLILPYEIQVGKSSVERSMLTGHLLIKMLKVDGTVKPSEVLMSPKSK